MRFFTRTAPTVLPCARRGGSVAPATTGGASAWPGAVDPTRTGGESCRLDRAAPETSWEF